MFAEDTRILQELTALDHSLKFRVSNKIIHFPLASVARRGLVVHETEGIVPGSSKIFCTRVDFPEPDGPDTISSSGAISFAAVIRCSAPVRAAFRSPREFPGTNRRWPALRSRHRGVS